MSLRICKKIPLREMGTYLGVRLYFQNLHHLAEYDRQWVLRNTVWRSIAPKRGYATIMRICRKNETCNCQFWTVRTWRLYWIHSIGGTSWNDWTKNLIWERSRVRCQQQRKCELEYSFGNWFRHKSVKWHFIANKISEIIEKLGTINSSLPDVYELDFRNPFRNITLS